MTEVTARFFRRWGELLIRLFEEAKRTGAIKNDADSGSLGLFVMSTIEGAILMCKASGDAEAFQRIIDTLKSTILIYRV